MKQAAFFPFRPNPAIAFSRVDVYNISSKKLEARDIFLKNAALPE